MVEEDNEVKEFLEVKQFDPTPELPDEEEVKTGESSFSPMARKWYRKIQEAMLDDSNNGQVITTKQIEFVKSLFDGNTLEKACQKLKIGKRKANEWLRDGRVQGYINNLIGVRVKTSKAVGKSVSDFWDELWDCFKSGKKKTPAQMQAAQMIGKIFGIFKERTINESYSRSELIFTAKSSQPELEASPMAGRNLEDGSPLSLPDGWPPTGEEQVSNLQGASVVREA